MEQKDQKEEKIANENDLQQEADTTKLQDRKENTADEGQAADNVAEQPEKPEEPEEWKNKYNELNDAHLRLMAEFDNYRKRTLKEKAELIKCGGEAALTNLLPVIDDMERAMENIRKADDIEAVAKGVELIFNKFNAYLSQQGVKAIEATGKPFDTELFEAVATIPAPTEDLKGKVIDNVQTGYTLYEKVIRHAKVVVGD